MTQESTLYASTKDLVLPTVLGWEQEARVLTRCGLAFRVPAVQIQPSIVVSLGLMTVLEAKLKGRDHICEGLEEVFFSF